MAMGGRQIERKRERQKDGDTVIGNGMNSKGKKEGDKVAKREKGR